MAINLNIVLQMEGNYAVILIFLHLIFFFYGKSFASFFLSPFSLILSLQGENEIPSYPKTTTKTHTQKAIRMKRNSKKKLKETNEKIEEKKTVEMKAKQNGTSNETAEMMASTAEIQLLIVSYFISMGPIQARDCWVSRCAWE